MFCVFLELKIVLNTSFKSSLELSGCTDVQKCIKLIKWKEFDDSNGAIKIKCLLRMCGYFK